MEKMPKCETTDIVMNQICQNCDCYIEIKITSFFFFIHLVNLIDQSYFYKTGSGTDFKEVQRSGYTFTFEHEWSLVNISMSKKIQFSFNMSALQRSDVVL